MSISADLKNILNELNFPIKAIDPLLIYLIKDWGNPFVYFKSINNNVHLDAYCFNYDYDYCFEILNRILWLLNDTIIHVDLTYEITGNNGEYCNRVWIPESTFRQRVVDKIKEKGYNAEFKLYYSVSLPDGFTSDSDDWIDLYN